MTLGTRRRSRPPETSPICATASTSARTGPGELAAWLPERLAAGGEACRVLGQVRAASGVRHQDGDLAAWTQGDETLAKGGGETFAGGTACRKAPR